MYEEHSMKSSSIIDHTSPAAVKAQKASLPISRTSGPGYERPERARTSHACEPCRERKTKCDGERPSCRRCLHTGTSCHYGYGKGWRKRKTAEDLNATSKKLQRYEALLNDISPLVQPEVRAMIEEVRQHIKETSPHSASDANDSTTSSVTSAMTPRLSTELSLGSGSTGRLPLTLPIPGPLLPHQQRSQPLSFDRMSDSTSPRLAHHPKSEASLDDASINRLPSITASGVLIENIQDASPTYPRPPGLPNSHSGSMGSLGSIGSIGAEHFSPPPGSSNDPTGSRNHADDWPRANASSTFRLTNPYYPHETSLAMMSHVIA